MIGFRMAASHSWHIRQYDDALGDLVRLRRFINECWRSNDGNLWDMHPGDLIWQRFMHEDQIGRWPERVRLWERPDGELDGYAVLIEKSRELIPCLNPAVNADAELISDMIDWAEAHLEALGIDGEPRVSVFADGPTATVLGELGLGLADDPPMLLNQRSLDAIPPLQLPERFQVRALEGEDEFEERVSVHREAFDPSRVTVEAYRRLRQAPGYDPELDLVCVAPDGAFASYCIAWYDPNTRLGEFEPVGARAAFRRQGLTRAVMSEGLRRLKERGATAAIVSCFASSEAACPLYESLGFREARRWVTFVRALS
jgi:ribosomal protein S18 acetylase RimI-like enzyme